MERKVAVIHTTVVTCDGINSRLKALVPDAEVMNIVDDSLLNDVKKEGMLTKEVTRRLLTYALEAQDWGVKCEAHKPYCRSREKEGCGGFLFGFRCV